ncbi:hypothetical protein [Martelella limonii]|uniref:hypothetical protein n=1 Tax=Martelella limonii TaxID=1647649 RepID=UPI001580F695|nr:hypothetical protein [Martelella limonii]
MPRHTKWCLTILVLASLTSAGGCARIPETDVDFVERQIPIGEDASTARLALERRGFAQSELLGRIDYGYNETTKQADKRPVELRELARRNIGFVDLKGEPAGQLSCFAKDYSAFLARGRRMICWTVDKDNLITWRQAGWVGVTL